MIQWAVGVNYIIDTYTKECHRIEVDRSIGGRKVTEGLSEVASMQGRPDNIVVDNGPEFNLSVMPWMSGHILERLDCILSTPANLRTMHLWKVSMPDSEKSA